MTEGKSELLSVYITGIYKGRITADTETIAHCLWQDKRTYNCSPKVHNSASSLG